VADASAQLEFLKRAFNAKENHVMRGPDGTIGHADVTIGDSHLMLGQARGEWTPMPEQLYLYLPDCDARTGRPRRRATSVQEPKTQFYGDRHGCVKVRAATCGGWRRTSKTCRPKKWDAA
jgi:uncharacterized glyoxalase superfamily protein PhnB